MSCVRKNGTIHAELQIRVVIEDNLKIIFHMYVVTPH